MNHITDSKIKHSNETNWYVITGGPSTGKTTTIDLLQKQGYLTTIEHARHYIDTMHNEGNSVEVPKFIPESEAEKQMEQYAIKLMDLRKKIEDEMKPFL